MNLVKDKPSHWYKWDSTNMMFHPCYEVEKADTSGMTPVTLRQARPMRLVPSVTNILGVLNKPGLERWKIEQAIMSALTLPKAPEEGTDSFAARVVEDMEAQSEAARSLGTAIHDELASRLLHPIHIAGESVSPHVKPVLDWLDSQQVEVGSVEIVVGDPALGYAGRCDFVGRIQGFGVMIDFKTQKVRRNGKDQGKPAFYDEWPLQLAAYRHAVGYADGACKLMSVVINTERPEPPYVKVWDEPDETREVKVSYFGIFQQIFGLWQYVNDYNPALF